MWWMLGSLARRMGADLLGGADPDDARPTSSSSAACLARSPLDPDAVFAAGPRGLDVAPEHGWVHDTMLPDGRWQIAPDGAGRPARATHAGPPADRAGAGAPARDRRGATRCATPATATSRWCGCIPADADAAGVVDGERAEVSVGARSVRRPVVTDAGMRPGWRRSPTAGGRPARAGSPAPAPTSTR